jgi:hypothetical protein
MQHWIKSEPLGDCRVVLVLDQVLAGKLLWEKFYEYVECPWDPKEVLPRFRRDDGKLRRPQRVSKEDLQRRRDSWLGKEFKFEIPLLPAGARYVLKEVSA